MGGKNQPKTGKSDIVVNTKPTNTRAGKKRKADAEAGGNSEANPPEIMGEAPLPAPQVVPGDIDDGVVDLSQRNVNEAVSENPEEDVKMMTEDVTVGNEGASTGGIPAGISGHTNEVGVNILAAMSSVSEALKNVSARVEQTQRDEQQAQRDLDTLKASVKDVGQRVTKLEESIKQQTSEMLQAISDAVTAVTASLEGQSADRTVVYMGQPGPSHDGMGGPRAHCSTQMTTEAPTQYCSVTYNEEMYRLLLTHQESTLITAATTLREFIRRILCKYHTIPELQKFTLRGIGANREPRPMLDAWLVELIIKAAQTWRPFPPVPVDERPDGPMNTLKKLHDANLSARVRRLISDILQYYRETRDPEGNMRRRQPRGDLAEQEQRGEDQEHPGEDGHPDTDSE